MHKMTKKFLEEAFCGESMAHMKYLIFAEIAEREGFPNLARLFRAIAYAEFVHARNYAKELGYVGKTPANLQTGIDGETFEVEEMYPAYDSVAELQNEKGAGRAFRFALEAEKIHAELYKNAKKHAERGEDPDLDNIHICPVCGYTHIGEPPDKCPICGLPKEKFEKF